MAKIALDEQTIRTMIREEIVDVLSELHSPKLRRSIVQGRTSYKAGKTTPYDQPRFIDN